MLVLARLLFMAISLYIFISFFLENMDDRQNSISYKIYLFLFIFIIQFLFELFGTILISNINIPIRVLIESSVNNALLAVIAYDIYNDLYYNGFYKTFTQQQRKLVLVLLIIGFMAAIKILELLISSRS